MGFIDAHVHVWTDDYETYPFAEGHDPSKAVPRTFHPDEILRHANESGVDRVVLVQMSYYADDNRYMLQVMQDHPGVFGGIGIVDPAGRDPAGHMAQLRESDVRGIRVYAVGGDNVATWCDSDGHAAMWAAGADLGMAICPLIGPDGLPALARRCEQFPETTVVIDHLCRIGAGGPVRFEDVDALCNLARFGNVMVKVSAFYALSQEGAPYDDMVTLIGRVVDAFGADRLMWASDAPYQVQPPHEYAPSVALIRDRLPFLDEGQKAAILGETAERLFFR